MIVEFLRPLKAGGGTGFLNTDHLIAALPIWNDPDRRELNSIEAALINWVGAGEGSLVGFRLLLSQGGSLVLTHYDHDDLRALLAGETVKSPGELG